MLCGPLVEKPLLQREKEVWKNSAREQQKITLLYTVYKQHGIGKEG